VGFEELQSPGLALTESMFKMAQAMSNVCEIRHPFDVITHNNPRLGNPFPEITGAAV